MVGDGRNFRNFLRQSTFSIVEKRSDIAVRRRRFPTNISEILKGYVLLFQVISTDRVTHRTDTNIDQILRPSYGASQFAHGQGRGNGRRETRNNHNGHKHPDQGHKPVGQVSSFCNALPQIDADARPSPAMRLHHKRRHAFCADPQGPMWRFILLCRNPAGAQTEKEEKA
jgi:hypothetical protein